MAIFMYIIDWVVFVLSDSSFFTTMQN